EIWDGTGEDSITVTEKTSSTNAVKGAVIKFDWDGDGVVKNVSVISTKGALTYTNGNQVRIEASGTGTGYDLADDVVVLNVDSKKDAGVSGNAIIEAAKDAEGNYINNVVFTTNSDGEIALLVIDVVNGAWED
ncbi:MAG: hypothetical protein GX585_04420, partial [Clostridiales bacterium]|nr:hypothetical protein [Clostridiales bacterium]